MNDSINLVMQTAKRIFFVGIGGISMSSLAFVCLERGYDVRGSDRVRSPMTERLEGAGIPVVYEHRADNIDGCDAVVYTGAVSMENPELAAAAAHGIPTIYRADLLGYIMKDYTHRIGISGMHGKSTATSMMAHMFLAAGRRPTVLSGAETNEMGGAYTIGGRDYFIFEACEYKDSFLCFYPTVSVVLDIDVDHTDYFSGGIGQIEKSFAKYAHLPFESQNVLPFTVANADDDNVKESLTDIPVLVTFGIKNAADYMAENIVISEGRPSFDIRKGDKILAHIDLAVYGYHNIYNALAAAAVGDMLGISAADIASTLATFEGLRRRFEYKCTVNGARVYIDYAHHPREIAATLRAARGLAHGRLICFFEPHTYSRTAALWDGFTRCFEEADDVYFLDIYAAREENIYGVSSEKLAAATPNAGYIASYSQAAETVRRDARPGDTVMILGAGTIDRVAELLTENE